MFRLKKPREERDIPDICHRYHRWYMWIKNGPCGEISHITNVEKSEISDFSTSPLQISPHVEKSDICPHSFICHTLAPEDRPLHASPRSLLPVVTPCGRSTLSLPLQCRVWIAPTAVAALLREKPAS